MKIASLRWTPYCLPFRRALVTSRRRWDAREGIIIEIETDAGIRGLGDVAPLPDFGTADVAACLRALEEVAPRLAGVAVADATCAFEAAALDSTLAPLRCAIESACLDVEARAAERSVASLLADAAPATTVAVNAIVADAGEAEAAVAAGYGCLKLKVGAGPPDEDAAHVRAVRRAIGLDVTLRLDANGAWSESDAIAFLRDVAPYDVEFIEQPVAAGDLTAMRRVRMATAVPVAADEDVTNIERARRVIEEGAADVLVIKPSVAGGPRRAMEIVEMARAAGVDVVVTSAMESGIGVAAALHVAAASATARACGLGTLKLLADDLVRGGLPLAGGAVRLPEGAGIGVTLDAGALHRCATSPVRTVRA